MYGGGDKYPKIIQNGGDSNEVDGYISNITNSTTIGFKYFECNNIKNISIKVRGYAQGKFWIHSKIDGELLGEVEIKYSNVWEKFTCNLNFPDGIQSIYFTYVGNGTAQFLSFILD